MMRERFEAFRAGVFYRGAGLLLLYLVSSACYLYRLERKLDPENTEFLNRVRYIITSREERMFLQLPESERSEFRKKFWRDRDPDPETEENEFKREYFRRMEQADEIFVTEGIAGWRTDRGRMLVLYGLPGQRILNRGGSGIHANCAEIWYYGNFPVVFLDVDCTGFFRLATWDLSPLLTYSLENQMMGFPKDGSVGRKALDSHSLICDVVFRDIRFKPGKLNFVISLFVPFAQMWFQEKGAVLETDIQVRFRLLDEENRELWSFCDTFSLQTDEASLQEEQPGFSRDLPVEVEMVPDGSEKIRYRVFVELINRTGGAALRRMMPLRP